MKSKNFIIALVLSCLFLAANASAQFDIHGQISGKVTDANGAPIKQARVLALNLTTLDESVVMTNNFGNFKFIGMPIGNIYLLNVSSKRHVFSFATQMVNLDSFEKRIVFSSDFENLNPFAMFGRDF